ncbi:MAG: YjbQ family protein, partial [Clostridiaceae bacterium]|nr:YjbQ family protein [Clostridiaceae bacterium]
MKSFRKELIFNTKSRRAFINITPQIEDCLYDSRIKEG